MSTYSSTAAPTKQSADSVNQSGTVGPSLSAGRGEPRTRAGHNPVSAQHQGVPVGAEVDRHHVAVVNLASQQHLRQLIADGLLHQPPQWPRAVDGVEPALGET